MIEYLKVFGIDNFHINDLIWFHIFWYDLIWCLHQFMIYNFIKVGYYRNFQFHLMANSSTWFKYAFYYFILRDCNHMMNKMWTKDTIINFIQMFNKRHTSIWASKFNIMLQFEERRWIFAIIFKWAHESWIFVMASFLCN